MISLANGHGIDDVQACRSWNGPGSVSKCSVKLLHPLLRVYGADSGVQQIVARLGGLGQRVTYFRHFTGVDATHWPEGAGPGDHMMRCWPMH